MFISEFKSSLEHYKKLKDFLRSNFNLKNEDSFDISNGCLNIIHMNFGEFYEEEIPLGKIIKKLDEDIAF